MWKLCVVDDESNRTVVKLVRGDYTVGRAEDNTIRLTERNISRSHARLYRDAEGQGDWHIEDRGSYTGSFVNGERVQGDRVLEHGDVIRLGDYKLELSDESQAEVDAKALGDAMSAASLPDRLIVVQGPGVGTVYPLAEQKLLVGRGEECQIALDDASVSRVHVEVLRTEHGLMILDQGSSNGLRINGTELPSAMLRSGDVVELGDVRLKFIPAGMEDVVTQAGPVTGLVADATQASVSSNRNLAPVYAAVALALVALVFLAVRPSDESSPAVTSVRVEAAEPVREDGPTRVLEDAKEMAARGNVVLAHRKLQEIPKDSPLRQSDEFRSIEQSWADEIFKVASQSPDLAERRSLLDKVAKTQAVDRDRRERAADELAKLSEAEELESVDVADLPSAETRPRNRRRAARVATRTTRPRTSTGSSKSRVTTSTSSKPTATKTGAQATSPAPQPEAPKPVAKPAAPKPASQDPAPSASTSTSTESEPPAAPKPKPKPTPKKPSADTDLVRVSPF